MTTPAPAAEQAGPAPSATVSTGSRRIGAIDSLRGLALIAMAIYHFGWDLEFFGYLERGATAAGGWKMLARGTAGSFLFLAGVGLVLAHGSAGPAIRWAPFLQRLAKIIAAAAVITVATYLLFPSSFIFFGILHAIGTFSLIGLAFLRVPALITLALASAAIAAPFYLRAAIFDTPALWWVGLSLAPPLSNDYVPLSPWIGPFLAGMAVTRLLSGRLGALSKSAERLAGTKPGRVLAVAGRHSLAVYLIHQPILIGCVYLASLVHPAPPPDIRAAYLNSCVAACSAQSATVSCPAFCACTLDTLESQKLFDPMNRGEIDMTKDPRIAEIADQCTRSSPAKE